MHLKPLPKLLQEPYLQALAIQRLGSSDWQSPVTVPSVTIRTGRTTDGTYSSRSYVRSTDISTLLSPIVGTVVVIFFMFMTPIPVFRFFALFRLPEFMGLPVVFRKVETPGMVFVVIPVVIVLVA